ncbi:MAG: T9SS type A sorting domain-containing protein [Chitinophagales bacterium]
MSTKLFRATITIFFILISATSLQAATVTWTGNTDANWDIGTNWDTGTEPTASDDVVIPPMLTNYPVISSTGNMVKSINMIDIISTLDIEVGADLTVSNSTSDAVTIEGTLSIDGDLFIIDAGESGLVNVGTINITGSLEITGTLGEFALDNTPDGIEIINNGTILIVDSAIESLFNMADLTNNGDLFIQGGIAGFFNAGNFQNFGTLDINIDDAPEGGAIYNTSQFTNNLCGQVITNNRTDNDVEGSSFDNDGVIILNGNNDNSGTITNNGIIYNPNSTALTTTGFGSVYTNLTTNIWTACAGTTSWETAENWSLGVEPDGTYDVIVSDFSASSTFPSISTTGSTAKSVIIQVGTSLQIETNGELTIDGSNSNGLHNLGTLTNDGGLSILNSASDGLRNENMATNAGTITITGTGDDGLFNQIGSDFLNSGTINITGNHPESGIDNRALFTNDGEININTSNSPSDGSIWNISEFDNSSCTTITINDEIDNGGAITFTNNGVITSTFNGVNVGTIENEGVIYNLNGGTFTTNVESNGFEFTSTNTTVWTNCSDTDTNWSNDGNWTADSPNDSKTAIVPAGVGFYPTILSTANVGELNIELDASVTNQSTLNTEIIDNSGQLFNDGCESIINITNNLTNNASGEIVNLGTINLLEASFTDNGTYEGNATGVSPPDILYVDVDAVSGNNDGTSWEDAYIDLQDALAFAATCPLEIWVAEGGYFPTSTSNRGISFYLPDGVELYGGFNGTETLRSERDFLLYETILSGDIGADNDDSDNSYQVIIVDEGISVKIDGFYIADGNANETDNEVLQNKGGGIYNLGEAIIQNCVFYNNNASYSGGAIFNGEFKKDNTKIVNCIFKANSGYAIANYFSDLAIVNTLISGNDGGGIDHTGSTSSQILYMSNCTVVGNHGEGIHMDETGFNAINSIFWDNEVEGIQNENTQISDPFSSTVSFSCIEGGWSGSGTNNIFTDPLFMTPIDPTTSPSPDGNFTLQPSSPAINTGDTASIPTDATDVDGDGNIEEEIDIDLSYNLRIQFNTLDMGCYEASCDADAPIWTGEIDTDWSNPLNWCPNGIPDANADVQIGAIEAESSPVIASNVGTVKSITLTNGTLTVDASGAIYIDGSDANGLNISNGTVVNSGNISVVNSSTNGVSVALDGDIFNNSEGSLYIIDPLQDGLKLTSNGEFYNDSDATLEISGAGENGLSRRGTSNLFNLGEININQTSPDKKLVPIETNSIFVTSGIGAIYNFQCASITFDDVLENGGTITNDGIIHADGTSFINTGTFLQGFTGIIFDPNDIFASPGGGFVNQGTILNESQASSTTNIWTGCAEDLDWDTADNWSLGTEPLAIQDVIIPSLGESSNYPTISTTGNVAKSIQINTNASLVMDTNSELTIDGGENGVFVEENADLEVKSLATLNILNTTNDGFENEGTTTIRGELNIQDSNDIGIFNYGIFEVFSGEIILGNSGTQSIVNLGNVAEFINEGTVLISHNSSTNSAISNATSALFVNDGELNIEVLSSSEAIQNLASSDFTNTFCSNITLNREIVNNANFTNEGLLTTTFDGTNNISGIFTNNGVINDFYNSFNGGADITNNSLIILPLTGCLGESIENALIDGGTNLDVSTNWYDGGSESSAGTYDSANNTFTPDNTIIEVGTHTLDFYIDDPSNECALYTSIEVTIENCVPDFIWTGGSEPANSDWNDPNNWSTGIIPDYSDEVTIADISPLTNYPIIDDFVEIGNLIIEANASVTIANGGELITFFTTTGIDIQTGASMLIEDGGAALIFEASVTGVNVDGNLNVSGHLFISSSGVGLNVGATGVVNDNGFIEINEGFGGIGVGDGKTGIISVVNFLEIQNGGTFEVTAGDTLVIDGTASGLGPEKAGFSDGDTGIKIFGGGTFTSEDTGVTQVINISGMGIDNEGDVNNSGEMTITAEDTGIRTSSTFTDDGSVIISKPEATAGFKKTGGASVVNFLEIQNGGTFEVVDDGDLTIDGEDVGPTLKAGFVNNDTGIDVNAGGTFTSETNTNIHVINMSGLSTGVVTNGTIDNGGSMEITVENTGMQIQSDTTENSGQITISKIEGLSFAAKTSGGASVVNFLEIQNGGTFSVLSGASLLINGQVTGAQKSGATNALLNDTGIAVNSGGTFIAETNSDVDVINMIGASIGMSTSGTVENDGDFDITTESRGVEVQAGEFNNGGDLDISKIDGLSFAAKTTGGASVVNFLEIQNGGTFSVLSGGSLLINGQDTGAQKSGASKAQFNDTGIAVNSGGTFIAETNSEVDVINMIGASIGMSTSGTVTNDGDFDMTTEGRGIDVEAGSFSNGGDLDISKIEGLSLAAKASGGASVVNFLEIQNGGTFSVLSGASLTIDGQSTLVAKSGVLSNDTGIDVNAGGTFEAQDSSTVNVINMIGASTGVVNNGQLSDAGDFTITTENIGMMVQSDSVEVSGTLTITVLESPSKSMLKKGAVSVVNFLEIQNGGTFEIASGGEVIVDGGGGPSKSGKLNNDVGVSIDSGGLLHTDSEAILQIKNIIGEGMGMRNDGTVNNDGTVDFNNIGGNALENNEEFNNNDCSVFITDSKVNNTEDADFLNQGLISSSYGENGEQHENDGMFVNEGIIEDPNNAFVNIIGNPIIEVDDGNISNYTLFTPMFTCFGENVENATNKPLDVNGVFTVNMWYTDISLTEVAGIYIFSEILNINRFVPNFNVLGPGTHTIYVSVDSDTFADCGATNVVLVKLTIYDLPEITPIDQAICLNQPLTTPLGVEDNGYDYTWYDQETGGNVLTTGTEYTPNPLPTTTTTYWVEAANSQSCMSDGRTAVTLTVYDLPETQEITSSSDFVLCEEDNIVLGAGNYPENYTYQWSNTATTQSITVTSSGIYTVTVTNENGCTTTADATLLSCCNAVAGTLMLVEPDVCVGDDLVVSTNGTHQTDDGYVLYYLLVNETTGIIEAVNTTGIFAGVAEGDYELYSYVELSVLPPVPSPVGSSNLLISSIGTSDVGCYDLSTLQAVTMPEIPSAEVTYSTTNGASSLTNMATITITGGTPSYYTDFTSTGAAFLNSFAVGVYTVNYSDEATWNLIVTDDNGCESAAWIIGSSDNPNVTINSVVITKETCIGDEDGAINIAVSGGFACVPPPAYTYSWTGPNGFVASTEDISNLVSGTYYVTINDCNGGSLTDDFYVGRQPSGRGRGRGSVGCATSGSKTDIVNSGETFLQVRPNPFSYYTTIEFGIAQTAIADITLYTLDGRKVKEIYHTLAENDAVHQIYFEAENISPGMYLLRLTTESGEMVIEKLVVQ